MSESLDTFGGTQTLPFRVGIIQVPLSMASTELGRMSNPEGIRLSSAEVQTPTFKSGTVEWVDYINMNVPLYVKVLIAILSSVIVAKIECMYAHYKSNSEGGLNFG